MTPPDFIVDSETLAALIGVAPKTVRAYVKRGMPGTKVGGTFRFNLKDVLPWLLDQQHDPGEDYKRARARKEEAQARLADLRYEEKVKNVVPVDWAAKALTRILSNVRARLLAIPNTLAPKLSRVSDEDDIQCIVRDAIYQAMREIVEHEAKTSKGGN